MTTRDARPATCAFCGYEVPASVRPAVRDGRRFCSQPCLRAFEGGEEPFAGTFEFKRHPLGVNALSAGLPEGIPGNAAVLLAGSEGTRLQALLGECVWRTLERGDPSVVVSMDRPQHSLVDSFLAHGWNVLPYLDRERLVVVDLFTSRLHDEEAMTRRANRWNGHLESVIDGAVRSVRDPSDVFEVANQFDNALQEVGLSESGLVAIDYLTELAGFTQATRAANLLREVRALVCKSRYVPLLAGASVDRQEDLYLTDFPHDHEYLFDGIVDFELFERDDGARIKRLSVRKMDDAPTVSRWFPYEFRSGGFVTVDHARTPVEPPEEGDLS
jgi:KaiC/GvpD/RAD55 family RecA-like ATPase